MDYPACSGYHDPYTTSTHRKHWIGTSTSVVRLVAEYFTDLFKNPKMPGMVPGFELRLQIRRIEGGERMVSRVD